MFAHCAPTSRPPNPIIAKYGEPRLGEPILGESIDQQTDKAILGVGFPTNNVFASKKKSLGQ